MFIIGIFFFTVAWMFIHLTDRPLWLFLVLAGLFAFIVIGSTSPKKKVGTNGRR